MFGNLELVPELFLKKKNDNDFVIAKTFNAIVIDATFFYGLENLFSEKC